MKILAMATKAAAARRGYDVQVSQHAPEGYNGAYSAQFFTRVPDKHDRDFDLGSTEKEARENLQGIVRKLL
jgi:hypothetical protein